MIAWQTLHLFGPLRGWGNVAAKARGVVGASRRGRARWPALCSESTAGKVSPAEEIGTASSSNSGVPLIFLSLALL